MLCTKLTTNTCRLHLGVPFENLCKRNTFVLCLCIPSEKTLVHYILGLKPEFSLILRVVLKLLLLLLLVVTFTSIATGTTTVSTTVITLLLLLLLQLTLVSGNIIATATTNSTNSLLLLRGEKSLNVRLIT